MNEGKEGDAVRQEAATRYGAWVAEQMQLRGWNAATLSRRSGVKKQTVGSILKGQSTQPTAWQIASIARAFGVEPNEIFEVTGLWDQTLPPPYVPSELLESYRDLGYPGRRALLGMSRLVKEMQTEYESSRRDRPSRADLESALAPAEDAINEAVEDDASLHQPGTMPEIEPVAADDDSDVKRAQRQREARREQKRRDESADGD